MKNLYFFFLLLIPLNIFAQSTITDEQGIVYNVLSQPADGNPGTCEVGNNQEFSNLTEVVIPPSVTSEEKIFNVIKIGKHAFSSNKNLEKVDLSQCIFLQSIEKFAFGFCNITNIGDLGNCKELQSIGEDAFSLCRYLKSVGDLGKCTDLKLIDNSAFYSCNILEEVGDLGKCTQLQAIEDAAFLSCYYLKSIGNLGNCSSLQKIGESAFYQCHALTSVGNLENCKQLKFIGSTAFRYCNSLISIALPESLEEIGKLCFNDCSELKEIYCYALTPPDATNDDDRPFLSSPMTISGTLYVPAKSVDLYKEAFGWKDAHQILPILINPSDISISVESDKGLNQIKLGNSIELSAFVSPDNSTFEKVEWTSEPKDAVEIIEKDNQGLNITVKSLPVSKAEKVTITAKVKDFEVATSIDITILPLSSDDVKTEPGNGEEGGEFTDDPVKDTENGAVIKGNDILMRVSQSAKLKLSAEGIDALPEFEWSVEEPSIASIKTDENSTLEVTFTGLAVGETTWGVKAKGSDTILASGKVTVIAAQVKELSLSTNALTIKIDDEPVVLYATHGPTYADEPTVVWTSTDEKVVKVGHDGTLEATIYPVGEGKATIKVEHSENPDVYDICEVTVEKSAGILNLFGEGTNTVDVYTVNGQTVILNADREKLNSLSPGLYIIREGNITNKVFVK